MRHLFVLACASLVFTAATPNPYFDPSCNREVKVLNAPMPDIAKADFKPHVTVNVLVTVGTTGKAEKSKVVLSSGSAAIDKAAVDSAMASTYKPAMSRCKLRADTYLFRMDTGNP